MAVYITSKELIATLGISEDELMEIQEFFDSIPDDEWELQEGKDYRIAVQSTGLREYTETGAYTIAKYLEKSRRLSFWQRILDWFTHAKRNLRQGFIRKKILENSSSLVKKNNYLFISSKDLTVILGTRPDYLRKCVEAMQRTDDALIKGRHFDEFPDLCVYYSMEGVVKVAQYFAKNLTKKNRREWCGDLGQIFNDQIERIKQQIQSRHNKIESTKNQVKQKDSKTCQVTGKRWTPINQLPLDVHHLYSSAHYPHLVATLDNCITITKEVHDAFHAWMGGPSKKCTPDDFIKFVIQYYPANTEVIIRLEQQKLALGNQTEQAPHVLYLPASQVI